MHTGFLPPTIQETWTNDFQAQLERREIVLQGIYKPLGQIKHVPQIVLNL